MKIVVLNYSGNVGKSTLARHLLMPRMSQPELFTLETVNVDSDLDNPSLRGKDLLELRRSLALVDDAVVDIGASNIEAFISALRQQEGAHEDVDYFVVPIAPSAKQQRDSINTIDALTALGVTPNRIRVIFNLVNSDDDPSTVFGAVFDYHAKLSTFTLANDAVVPSSPLFELVSRTGQSLPALVADKTDLRKAIADATKPEDKIRFVDQLAARGMASSMTRRLDSTFATLFA